ncbi:E2-like enzyme [Scheffersomyces spartinae]|uniref:Autophagy-related protein 3 n=1 Tax=Scheffersomyces spartinae TaxID=45513 RepID=A0A9P7VCR3_9ASCO|nr:E2-like enzyme [Scheffersomyces spartinae]KAG7195718.1 E2-like enzyme [Scheffersomyces spartinae]
MASALRSKLSSLREYLTPINHSSNFATTGEISPEEFVAAGDYLVSKFPTWQWGKAPRALAKSFLPEDKQFLVTRKVPLYQRANDYLGVSLNTKGEGELDGDEDELDEDGWIKNIASVKLDDSERLDKKSSTSTDIEEIYEDIDDFADDTAEGDVNDNDNDNEEDEEDLEVIDTNSTIKLRKYDLYITYSTSYRVPKLYLVGFNANGIPLLPQQMFEDINNDYKDKTATIENLPVSHNTTSVSIHPCKHASVMKVLMKHSVKKAPPPPLKQDDDEDDKDDKSQDFGVRVDQYLIIFLKFIASVTPGIEYDYTMDAL